MKTLQDLESGGRTSCAPSPCNRSLPDVLQIEGSACPRLTEGGNEGVGWMNHLFIAVSAESERESGGLLGRTGASQLLGSCLRDPANALPAGTRRRL